MSIRRILQWVSAVTLTILVMAGCSGTQAGPTATPAPLITTSTPTPVLPSATPTSTPLPTSTPTATPTLTPSPTPLPTWSRGFQLGAFVDDIPGHNELMLANGMTWTARQVRYSGESRANEASIELAHDNGLRILLAVTGDGQRAYESDYQATFVSFLASLAQQGADAIEVWNEPNLDREMAVVDPAQYTALLCASYTAIKEANPETLVISGAPAPTSFFGGCTLAGCDDLPWMQGLAEAGAAECLDFIGVHYITGATSPNEETGHPIGDHYTYYFHPMVERYDEAVGGAHPLAFTTFGYLSPEGYDEVPQWFAWSKDTTIAEQAEWTVEAVRMSIESDKIGMIIIWNLDSADWGGEYNDVRAGWALIRQDGSCPACEALHELLLQQ